MTLPILGKLLMPHDEFYNYVIKLEDIFVDNFPSIATNYNIGSIMKDLLCNVRFSHPCELFNKQFIIDLFIRFRIFTAIKFFNRTMFSTNIKKKKISYFKTYVKKKINFSLRYCCFSIMFDVFLKICN